MEREEREDIPEMLEEVLELSRENNRMLHSLKRGVVFRRILSWVYFLVFVGSLLFAYYFMQPYLNKVATLYNAAVPAGASSSKAMIHEFLEK